VSSRYSTEFLIGLAALTMVLAIATFRNNWLGGLFHEVSVDLGNLSIGIATTILAFGSFRATTKQFEYSKYSLSFQHKNTLIERFRDDLEYCLDCISELIAFLEHSIFLTNKPPILKAENDLNEFKSVLNTARKEHSVLIAKYTKSINRMLSSSALLGPESLRLIDTFNSLSSYIPSYDGNSSTLDTERDKLLELRGRIEENSLKFILSVRRSDKFS
jgi:hypothetical protein